MKKIRILQIIFDTEIKGQQISAFRGAIASKVGQNSNLFHNHTTSGFIYNYPFIQYKRLNKKAAIVCVEQGVDEIYILFNQPDWQLNLNGSNFLMKIEKLNVNAFNLNVWDNFFSYRIFNWIALNPENHKKFRSTDSLTERIIILENILKANILSFAKGVEWILEEDKKIELKITNIIGEKVTRFKNISHVTFDVEFKTNVFLPQHIGMGKAASHGYGVVYAVRKKIKSDEPR
ncbi:MAG: hypothetical protein JXL97_00275 [Bacteroidales bacterium]|nr:hypothetical protein [Bacteroidales bacterium]